MIIFVLIYLLFCIPALCTFFLRQYHGGNNAGWLVTILTVPIMGPVSFFFLRIHKHILEMQSDNINKNLLTDLNMYSSEEQKQIKLNILAQNLGYAPYEAFDAYEILKDQAYFDSILEAIRNAKKSIYIIEFLFSGKIGHLVVDEMKAAQKRGVTVKLLIDALGFRQLNYSKELDKKINATGFSTFYNRFNKSNFFRLNHRLHSKIVCVDDEYTWIGSHNIRDLYEDPNVPHIHNVSIKIKSTIAAMHAINYIDYLFKYNKTPQAQMAKAITKEDLQEIRDIAPEGQGVNQLSFSLITPLSNALAISYANAILSAKESCYLITPYFIPTKALTNALNLTIARGVDVQIIVPLHSNHTHFENIVNFTLRSFERRGGQNL